MTKKKAPAAAAVTEKGAVSASYNRRPVMTSDLPVWLRAYQQWLLARAAGTIEQHRTNTQEPSLGWPAVLCSGRQNFLPNSCLKR